MFWVKKGILGPKNYWTEKILWSKFFWGPRKFVDPKRLWVKKIWTQKRIWVRKIMGFEN